MPKKTRKQKILSDTHRKNIVSSLTYTYSPNQKLAQPVRPKVIDSPETYVFIRKDIYKTLIVAIVFFIIEIAVSIYSHRIGW